MITGAAKLFADIGSKSADSEGAVKAAMHRVTMIFGIKPNRARAPVRMTWPAELFGYGKVIAAEMGIPVEEVFNAALAFAFARNAMLDVECGRELSRLAVEVATEFEREIRAGDADYSTRTVRIESDILAHIAEDVTSDLSMSSVAAAVMVLSLSSDTDAAPLSLGFREVDAYATHGDPAVNSFAAAQLAAALRSFIAPAKHVITISEAVLPGRQRDVVEAVSTTLGIDRGAVVSGMLRMIVARQDRPNVWPRSVAVSAEAFDCDRTSTGSALQYAPGGDFVIDKEFAPVFARMYKLLSCAPGDAIAGFVKAALDLIDDDSSTEAN